jgi:hypothetical protein
MAQLTFNDLLFAFQSSVIDAQKAVTARFEESGALLRKTKKKVVAGPFHTAAPLRDGESDEVGIFSLSNTFFRGQRPHRISVLSLEFDCFLENKGATDETCRYIVKIKNGKAPRGNAVHRMVVVFGGSADFAGIVGLDGQVFMEVPPFHSRKIPHKTNKGKKPFFLRIFKRFGTERTEDGFIMNEKQTVQARKIAELFKSNHIVNKTETKEE